MVDPMPLEPPTETNRLREPNSHVSIGRITLSLSASVVSSIPCFGYHVHASRTEQMVAIWLALAWIAGVTLAVILIVALLAYPSTHRGASITNTLLLIYTLIASLVGFGGVRNAVMELLAG
jgi:hypothetical protein